MERKWFIAVAARKVVQGLGLALVLGAFSSLALAGVPDFRDAPEIDPGSIISALTLVTGGVMVFAGRRRG